MEVKRVNHPAPWSRKFVTPSHCITDPRWHGTNHDAIGRCPSPEVRKPSGNEAEAGCGASALSPRAHIRPTPPLCAKMPAPAGGQARWEIAHINSRAATPLLHPFNPLETTSKTEDRFRPPAEAFPAMTKVICCFIPSSRKGR